MLNEVQGEVPLQKEEDSVHVKFPKVLNRPHFNIKILITNNYRRLKFLKKSNKLVGYMQLS